MRWFGLGSTLLEPKPFVGDAVRNLQAGAFRAVGLGPTELRLGLGGS
jgi:hypothetical protein